MGKRALRHTYLARRRRLSVAERQRWSQEICKRIVRSSWFMEAERLLLYMPIRQEVDIRPVMEKAWEQRKMVYLPRSEPRTKTMAIYEVRRLSELHSGTYGIMEPQADERRIGEKTDLDAVVIPGVVFDKEGYRIGYGAGYFDRFLEGLGAKTTLVGVAYSIQLTERIPHERHDQRLHKLVTEKESLTFGA